LKKRKKYEAPKVRSERVKLGVFGQYDGQLPIPDLEPFFGQCPPCDVAP